MSRRRLSDEERALWRGVTRSIAPLRPPAVPGDDEPSVAPPPPKRRPKPTPVIAARPVVPSKPVTPQPVPLGRRARRRIARGSQEIDGRLDLHGMTQAKAHDALFGFLQRIQARGGRLVLVITGKGSGDASAGRGVLRRLVPLWLHSPEFRHLTSGIETAGIRHGGEGALYITLRRAPHP